jgi:hypothetical protein
VTAIIDRKNVPDHLFSIPELDFSDDLFAEPLSGTWFRLGARTLAALRDERGVENQLLRASIVLPPGKFAELFASFDAVGHIFDQLGKPGGVINSDYRQRHYSYAPFHRFDFPFTAIAGEPLVFHHSDTSHSKFLINPDIWLYLELEEKTPGTDIWWDPRRGIDVVSNRVIENGSLEIVEIRSEYLLKYIKARQMSLLVCHFRRLLLFDPTQHLIDTFVKEDFNLGSPEQNAKTIVHNWGLMQRATSETQYLSSELHLWFEIKPPAIDLDAPWSETPPFDIYTFTLPTDSVAVAPARWSMHRPAEGRTFAGGTCGFMDRVYFRQEVLTKYEGASGFEVRDDGSVLCPYWQLSRSTARIGNELLTTAIGDFAQGVPYEEWLHWQQYAVEAPSHETLKVITEEVKIPDAVNNVLRALHRLNRSFASLAATLSAPVSGDSWRGSHDSLACRQLKWVYLATASDDEFLKRATLASTFFLDGLYVPALRDLLVAVGKNLDQNHEKPPKALGSRKLLQRLALIALLIESIKPDISELPSLVQRAESKATKDVEPELKAELERIAQIISDSFAPLAFLYDLRTHGGLAHPPNQEETASAAVKLGLPKGKWRRVDYLGLLAQIATSVNQISEHLDGAAYIITLTNQQ